MKFKRALSVLLAVAMVFSCFAVGVVATSAEEVDAAVTAADVDVAAAGSTYSDMLNKTKAENGYGLMNKVDDSTILQAWTWSFKNIENNLDTIAEQGFTTVQVSPPNEIKKGTQNAKFLQSDNQNGWWMYDQPAGFQLNNSTDNALGTKADFISMCEKAHQKGIKIIVDAVVNHMGTKDGDDSNTSTDPMSHVTPRAQTFEPAIYNGKLFHSPWKQMQYIESNASQYDSTYDLTRNCTSGLPDLMTENATVQNAIYEYLDELLKSGADGFRFDAAKHIETPDDISSLRSDFWTNTLNKARQANPDKEGYAYGEILNTCGINRPYSMYFKYMQVTDNCAHRDRIMPAIKNGSGTGVFPFYSDSGNSTFTKANTVQWEESHDTYIDGTTTSLTVAQRNKIWAAVAGRADITSVYLARPSDNTNTNDLYNITIGEARKTAWANDVTKAVNQFHNYFAGQGEYTSVSGNKAMIERGTTGAIIITMGGTNGGSVSLTANKLANGTYKDAISGNTFTVANKKVTGTVGNTGVAAIYENEETPEPIPTEPPETYILGDVDGDGEVDAVDATLILRYSIDLITLTDKQLRAADVDGDGMVTPIDATFIQRYGAQMTVKYPIGQEQTVVPVAPTTPVIPTTVTPTTVYPTTHDDPENVTLYFSNNKFWDSVNVYMFSTAGGESTEWPGVAANKVATNDFGEDIYSVTVNTNQYDSVIFNGTGGQTVDIDVANAYAMGAGIYCLDTQDDQGHYDVDYYEYGPVEDPTSYEQPTTHDDPNPENVTLYFSNNKFWDSVNVYMFSTAGGESTAWPGVAANKIGTNDFGEDIYSVTVNTNQYDSVIFNGSGGQTVDIDVANAFAMGAGVYCLDTQDDQGHYDVGYYEYGPVENPTSYEQPTTHDDPNPENVTLYFSNNKSWGSVNVYMFSTAGGESTAWPGVAADKVGTNTYGEDIYSVTVNTNQYDSVIFNGSGGQTVDISVSYAYNMGSGLYCLDTQDGNGHYDVGYYEYEGIEEPDNPDNPNPPSVNGGFYLVGGFSNWEADEQYKLSENSANPGEYMISTTLSEGDGVKVIKVENGTTTWYPDGMDNEYIVDAAHAGSVTVYFNPNGNGEWSAFGGFMYIEGGNGGNTDPTQGGSDTTEHTFLLTDNFGWGTAYVYAWDDDGNEINGAWPGSAQAETQVNDYGETQFVCHVPAGATGVILSNGNGAQTEDIKDFNHAGYWMSGKTNDLGHFLVTAWD